MPSRTVSSDQSHGSWPLLAGAMTCLLLCCLQSAAASISQAQPADKAAVAGQVGSKPDWRSLTPGQQAALQPLADKWPTLGEGQKRKWIAISANYGSMAPAEQVKLHSRMTEWVSLSPQQRAQARLNFAQSKQLTPSQKAATWNAYNALSSEKKEELARSATSKPPGAAPAPKPVQAQKLAKVPASTPASKVAKVDPTLNQKTLLPRTTPDGAAPLKN
jgi:hypothetical protein